jgi:membrane protein YqaA with SNARE-associated domain
LAADFSEISSSMSAQSVPRLAFLAGPRGILLSFFWGLAEGTLFFVVPDVFLSLIAVISPRRVWRHILSAVFGAVCAGALMYSWAARNPTEARALVAKVPFIPGRMFGQVRSGYERHGIAAIFLGPLSGIPYKIYAIEAPSHLGFWGFLAATAPARAWRFTLVCLFSAAAAHYLQRKWHKDVRQLLAIHGFAWILFYAFYWSRILLTGSR